MFSVWYVIAGILLVMAIASVVAFVLMDKKDKALIEDLKKSSTAPKAEASEQSKEEKVEQSEEAKTE